MKSKSVSVSNDISLKASIAGIVCSVVVSLVLILVVTMLLHGEKINEEHVGILSFIIQTVSTLAGCILSSIIGKGNKLLQALITAGAYFVLLVAATILFFDGAFHNVLQGLIAVLLGVVIFLIPIFFPKKGRYSVKFKKFSR